MIYGKCVEDSTILISRQNPNLRFWHLHFG